MGEPVNGSLGVCPVYALVTSSRFSWLHRCVTHLYWKFFMHRFNMPSFFDTLLQKTKKLPSSTLKAFIYYLFI
jgi:hypothetical protein